MNPAERVFLDAGRFIGALLAGDPRHAEAQGIVEAPRRGELVACTSVGVLAEVYAALTWVGALPRHQPDEAAAAVRALTAAPSRLLVLETGSPAGLRMLELAERHRLTARRIHDARHAATALVAGVSRVFTYDRDDWQVFAPDGIVIAGPPSVLTEPAQ
ncbi:MAG: type II toxin-antitoxin system VapC family toxin [Chromatiaceae bacterium]|nr:type II toxin-antitoxin system VapC family toxin [Chromatiaceae bacterium]